MTKKLIALDVDGTLLHHDGHLAPAVKDAVAAVVRAGHHVVIATGRSLLGADPILRMLDLRDGFLVTSNGAVTSRLRDGDARILQMRTFEPGPVLEVLRDSWPDAVVAIEDPGVGTRVSAPFPEGEVVGPVFVEPWEQLASRPTTRLTFRSPTASAHDFLQLTHRLGLHGVNYAVGYTAWLDINPEGVSKASALEGIRVELGIDPADTVAIGDHSNDLEMLAWAGRGVAMGQAIPEVLAAADEITGTIEEDGAATLLRSLL